MKPISRIVSCSFLLLVVIGVSLAMATPQALAMQREVRTASSQPTPVFNLGFQPSIAGILLPVRMSIDSNGTISFGPSEWAIETPLGIVTLSGQLSYPLAPQVSPQAQQTPMSAADLLLIIRHKQGGALQDANYLFQAKQAIQSVDIQGVITEVSVRWTGQNYMVFVDASRGTISGITLQGVAAGTTTPAKVGCPGPVMLAWSMNLPSESLKQVSGSPCTFEWTNPGASFTNWVFAQANGADSLQCPTGYGSASVQLSFPWWHPWDQGETQTCDGKHASVLNDMAVADGATITFHVSATVTTTSTTVQTCMIVLAGGLNIRMAPTSQSALVAHYPSGTVLNFVQVVNGESVNGDSLWGLSRQGHYFWLGGTDHPNG